MSTLKSSRSRLQASVGTMLRSESTTQTLDWSFLDGVYLITCPNADPDGERVQKAKEILSEVGLSDKLEVKEFDTDDENRIRGCYTSHISVLNDVVNANKLGQSNPFDNLLSGFLGKGDDRATPERNVNIMVLEDNLALTGSQLKQQLIDSVASYMVEDRDWDMIHLSYIPYVPDLQISRTTNEDIVKLSCGVGSALGTTAYIINTKAIKTLLADDKENNGFYAPIPDVMAKLFPETRYAANPTIFVRAPNTKSLVNPQLDDLRSLLFQPAVAALVQQILIVSGITTNALLPLVVLVLLAASGLSLSSTAQSIQELLATGSIDGPILFPVLSALFSVFSLAIVAQGALLAPKQESTD